MNCHECFLLAAEIFPLHGGAASLISALPFDHLPQRSRSILKPEGKERAGHSYLLVGEGHMAYDDALFQLGMDLTRSSTAQKEDHGDSARVAPDERKDFFIERDGVRFAGTHLIIDLFGARRLDDLKYIERTLKRCVEVAGATLLDIRLHHFTP